MVKILHAADFHLDSPFAALSQERARLRREESRHLPERLVEYANDHGAQLLLLSGDLFDGDESFSQTAQMLSEALGRFRGQVVIAPGNHDPYTSQSPYQSVLWPENVHIFHENSLEKIEFPQYRCVVWGAAFTGNDSPEISMPEGFAEGEDVQLLVLHGDVAVPRSPYRPIRISSLETSGIDYAALGHVHTFDGVHSAGETAYAYAGCPEGRGFDELDDKGFLFGTVAKGNADLTFVPFARRRYRKISVDVADGDALRTAEGLLTDAAHDICRVTFTGEGTVDEAEAVRRLTPLAWQLEVRDETRQTEDIWSRCGEDSLRGLFLADLRKTYEKSDEAGKAAVEQAARFGLAAMDNREL